jgi:hypothetical protein
MNVKQLKHILNTCYHDDDVITYELWSREDIQTRATILDIYCTEKQAIKILEEIHDTRSGDYGISWDTVDYYLNELDQEEG